MRRHIGPSSVKAVRDPTRWSFRGQSGVQADDRGFHGNLRTRLSFTACRHVPSSTQSSSEVILSNWSVDVIELPGSDVQLIKWWTEPTITMCTKRKTPLSFVNLRA